MENYLNEIEIDINKQFKYLSNWLNEIGILEEKDEFPSKDTTYLLAKKNYVIIGLNSINEYLLELIIKKYYEIYFEHLLNETQYNNYINYEKLKIEKVITENHDGTYKGFMKMINLLLGNVIGNGKIDDYIRKDFGDDFDNFTNKLSSINKMRNQIGHNSELYFKTDKSDSRFLINLINDINFLQSSFIILSKSFYNSMDGLLNFKYKTLNKFGDINKKD